MEEYAMRGAIITAIWLGLGFGATQLIADALEKWRTAPQIERTLPFDSDVARAQAAIKR